MVLAEHGFLTMTKLYNVREKLKSGAPLNESEKAIHDAGCVGVIHELHNKIDAAVAEAYGWPIDLSDDEILSRLVALNKERAEEEKRGMTRWLRPIIRRPAPNCARKKKSRSKQIWKSQRPRHRYCRETTPRSSQHCGIRSAQSASRRKQKTSRSASATAPALHVASNVACDCLQRPEWFADRKLAGSCLPIALFNVLGAGVVCRLTSDRRQANLRYDPFVSSSRPESAVRGTDEKRVSPQHVVRLHDILAVLDRSREPDDMNLPGFRCIRSKANCKGIGRFRYRETGA